ncbi:DUF2304 family protein [Pseudolysinimonas sp.]|uniref:DUF2304 family protein n=1 Tax=Pseudolysinimonas sp. TaxID=2680009 RepID=UPI003F817A6C
MSVTSYVLGIIAAVASLVFVVELLRRGRLRERHAIWWMIASLLSLVIGIFPGTLTFAARVVGINVPTNLVFFVSIAVLFLVCIQYATELTLVEERNRRLAETVALLEVRVAQLEGARPAPPGVEDDL